MIQTHHLSFVKDWIKSNVQNNKDKVGDGFRMSKQQGDFKLGLKKMF